MWDALVAELGYVPKHEVRYDMELDILTYMVELGDGGKLVFQVDSEEDGE